MKAVVKTEIPKELPNYIDLSVNTPFVLNQGSTPHCVGFGITHAMNSDLNQNNKMPVKGLSPEYLYSECKRIEGNTSAGTQIKIGLQIANKYGVCTWNTAPFIGNETANYILKVTNTMRTEALNYKIKTYARLYNMDEIKQALYAGKFVVIGTIVTQNNWLDGDDYILLPDGTWLGAHCSVLCGYDDNKEFKGHKGFFKGINSWGTDWADEGFYYMAYDYAKHTLIDLGGMPCLFEAWAIEVEGDIVRREFKMDTIPILDQNSRTLVPVRFVAEALGGIVEWKPEYPKKIKILLNDKSVEMEIGSDKYIVTQLE